MKAAVVTAAGKTPIYTDFEAPTARPGMELVSVKASALTHLTKARASGAHYSADNAFPAVAGTDGVGLTQDGRRVYFVLPEAPFGAMAEQSLVRKEHCVVLPEVLDDITAAAIANPGMSAWAALVERAHLVAGETVLVNGATGSAGRMAVQLAKYLGAAKVIATGRNVAELEALKQVGADIVIAFNLGPQNPEGAKAYEQALREAFASGIHVVIDYLWGTPARIIMLAIAKAVEDSTPVRFVHVGEAAGEPEISLPGAALRSSSLVLMGSGLKSVPLAALLQSIASVFAAVGPAALQIATEVVPLSAVQQTWDAADTKSRVVFRI